MFTQTKASIGRVLGSLRTKITAESTASRISRIQNRKMTTLAYKSLTVLRLGPTVYAEDAWQEMSKNYNVKIVECKPKNRQEFISDLRAGKYADADYITRTFYSANWTGLFDKELAKEIKEHTKVKAVSHNGAGYDQVDAVAFGELGIQVSNVPGLVDNATADTHIYLLLGAMRVFQLGTERMKLGLWPKELNSKVPMGHDPEGKVVGIFGMGGIGRAIRDRLIPFHPKEIIYHNRHQLDSDLEGVAKYVSFDELLAQSDIICVSIPLNSHTKHIINKDTIGKMKDGVVIINTARGAVIDEADMIPALKSGKVGALGSDVWENEPNANPEIYNLPNVTALPHLGTHTIETAKEMEEYVVKNVETFAETGKVLAMVPELKGKF